MVRIRFPPAESHQRTELGEFRPREGGFPNGQLTQLWERPFDRPPRGWHRRCRRADIDRLPSESTGTLLCQYQSAACCSPTRFSGAQPG